MDFCDSGACTRVTSAPFTYTWNITSSTANGTHSWFAIPYDSDLNAGKQFGPLYLNISLPPPPPIDINLMSRGTPIASVTSPTGSGSKNLNIIKDGVRPTVGSSNSSQQYDTYSGSTRSSDWIGYSFSSPQTFNRVVFQEGMHFWDGGWFYPSSLLKVQVRQSGSWVEAPSQTISPSYYSSAVNTQTAHGSSFESFTFDFPAIIGDAIRLYGTPGGSGAFISVAELEVWGKESVGGPVLTPLNATYYVALTGNDSNPGTQAAPWRTIQKAANTTTAGDTVLIGGGIYNAKVSFTKSGSVGKPITFKNVQGQAPVIDGVGLGGNGYTPLVDFSNVSYVTFDGFEVRNSAGMNVNIGGASHHLQLTNLNIHDSVGSSGIFISESSPVSTFTVIRGNRVYNNSLGGITLWLSSGGYYLIENNEVYGNRGNGNYDGIQVGGNSGGTHHVVVRNNIIHDNGSTDNGEDNLDMGGHSASNHYLSEGNTIYGTIGSVKLHANTEGAYMPPYHISRFNKITGIGNTTYGYPDPVVWYNNTFYNCGQCVFFWGDRADVSPGRSLGDSTYIGGDTGRMNWKNNIFIQKPGSSAYAILLAGPSGYNIDTRYNSVRFQNNLYEFSIGGKISWEDSSDIGKVFGSGINDAIFSSYKNSHAPDFPDTGSMLTTALHSQIFTDPANRDYRLVASSPAIDKGAPLTKTTNYGTNSTLLSLERVSYFQDGYCKNGECVIAPDYIRVGNNAPVQIISGSINDGANTLTLATPISWTAGAPVYFARSDGTSFSGTAPDVGAFEYFGAALPIGVTTYYVDPITGNDANTGTSASVPWKTPPGTRNTADTGFLNSQWGSVSQTNKLKCSDTILLKGGSTQVSAQGGAWLIDPTYYPDCTLNNAISIRISPTWGSGPFTLNGANMTATYSRGRGWSDHPAVITIAVSGLKLLGVSDTQRIKVRGKGSNIAAGVPDNQWLMIVATNYNTANLRGFRGDWLELENAASGFMIGRYDDYQVSNSIAHDLAHQGWGTGLNAGHKTNRGAFVNVTGHDIGCGSRAYPTCTRGIGSEDIFEFNDDISMWCVRCTAYNGGERGFNNGVIGNTTMGGNHVHRYRDIVSYNNGNGPSPCKASGPHFCEGAGMQVSGNDYENADTTHEFVLGGITWGNFGVGIGNYTQNIMEVWNASQYRNNVGRSDEGDFNLNTTSKGFRVFNSISQKANSGAAAWVITPGNANGAEPQKQFTPIAGSNCFRSYSVDSEGLGSSAGGWPGLGTYLTPPAWIDGTNKTTRASCDPKFTALSTNSFAANNFRLTSGSTAINAGRSYLRANGSGSGNMIIVKNNGGSGDPRNFFIANDGSSYPEPLTTDTEFQIEGACGVRHVISMTATTITFDGASCSWADNAMVHRPWNGSRPDMGAFEF